MSDHVLVSNISTVGWETSLAGLTFATSTFTAPVINGIVTTTGLTMPAFNTEAISGNTGITSVGTIETGTWSGTAIPAKYGGTALNTSASTGPVKVSGGTWSIPVLTNGQILIGGASPTAAALTAGYGCNIANGAGSISVSFGGLTTSTIGFHGQDFMGDVIPDIWNISTDITGTGVLLTGPGINGGQVRLATGTTAYSNAALVLGNATVSAVATTALISGTDNLTIEVEARVKFSNLTGVLQAGIGLGESATGFGAYGVYIGYHSSEIDSLVGRTSCGEGSTTIPIIHHTAVINTWYILKIVYASGIVTFSINDLYYTHYLYTATSTTNLPTGDMNAYAHITNSTDAVDYNMIIDYMTVKWTRSAND